jgi:hypothetical protein
MTLQYLAASAPRPRSWWLVAVAVLAASTVVGCSHNRQSYRPIYAGPGSTSAPCTNCGSRATVTTDEPISASESTVPPLSGPSSLNSTGPSTVGSFPGRSGGVRSSTVESVPKSQIGPEPEYDEVPPATMDRRNSNKPPAPGGTTSPGPGPALQAPSSGASPSTLNLDTPAAKRVGATATKPVRLAGLNERLQPFIAGSSANELFYPNKADRPWKYIVLHHSASTNGNYDQIDGEHRKILGYDGCGYHFVIGNGTGSADGQIEVAQRWNNQKQGVHCRNARSHEVDEYGIGICLVGDLDQQPPTPRQVAAAQALILYLSQRYRVEPGHVSTHAHLAATPTVCPGKFFPSESILTATMDATTGDGLRTTWGLRRLPRQTY